MDKKEKFELSPEERESQTKHSLNMRKNALIADHNACDVADKNCRKKQDDIRLAIDKIDVEIEGFTQGKAIELKGQIMALFRQFTESQIDFLREQAAVNGDRNPIMGEKALHDNTLRARLVIDCYTRATGTK